MAEGTREMQPANAKLIRSKEELKKQLEDRIKKGKELLLIEVPPQIYINAYGESEYIYDESAKDDFFKQYKKWNKYNIELFNALFDTANKKYTKEYQSAGSLFFVGDVDIVEEQKKEIKREISTLESFIERLDLIPSAVENQNQIHSESKNKAETIKTQTNLESFIEILDLIPFAVENQIHSESKNKAEAIKTQTNRVFIVHGHDETVKAKVALCLTKLGLEPIILHEQKNGGKTIIEKIEENSSDVGFAVILLTADDEGKSKSKKDSSDYKSRARQNVVFEMGYFVAKLGRERVCLLLEDGVEKPGDLDGIVYNVIDAKDSWKYDLAKELRAAGYDVSADKL
ncbi:ABC-type sugar transport system, periplasmic component [Bacteroidales bacterium Barb6]|nr:ABC-type sugar transport system, periplasmic component [Bacteroidales bacterium Barb6]